MTSFSNPVILTSFESDESGTCPDSSSLGRVDSPRVQHIHVLRKSGGFP